MLKISFQNWNINNEVGSYLPSCSTVAHIHVHVHVHTAITQKILIKINKKSIYMYVYVKIHREHFEKKLKHELRRTVDKNAKLG